MPTPDPLVVTVDASGRRWMRCARCVGSGTIRRLKESVEEGNYTFEEPPCPDCKGAGQVEVYDHA